MKPTQSGRKMQDIIMIYSNSMLTWLVSGIFEATFYHDDNKQVFLYHIIFGQRKELVGN